MKPGSLIMLILGIVLTLFGAALVAGGTVAALGNSAQGRDGYFSSPSETFSTDSYALINRIDAPVSGSPDPPGPVNFDLASLRLEATSTAGEEIFIGIAPVEAVGEYLAGVHHTEVRDIQSNPFRVRYVDVPGSQRPAPPISQDFWIDSASGPGQQSITTSWQPGGFAIVVMNPDASQAVSADVRAGARVGFLGPAATALLWIGGITVVVGLLLLVLGVVGLARGSSSPRTGPPVGAGAPAPPGTPTPADRPRYPAG